jgi:carbon monoxide dehydrogenase subunit G
VLPAPPQRVHHALRDPEVMARLLPASRDLREVGPGRFEGEVVIGLPPLGARYPVTATATLDAGELRLAAAGGGRAEGLRLDARCLVEPAPGAAAGTRLRYDIAVELGALGRWVPGFAADRAASDFLDALRRELDAPPRPAGGR